ncbi:MAG: diacylglycerol kinase family protein [Planctomycetota bacterium]|nr:diacylglycerol kinase family protein [Planctomycetota bacterium]
MPGQPESPPAVLLIANPVSGGGRARRLAPQLLDELQRRNCHAELFYTSRSGDARERARTAGDEPWDCIVAVGGDGTVAEILNGMPDPSRPLGMLPVGTANVLASEYRLPHKPAQVAELVCSRKTREHSIGLLGDQRFLLFCGIGVDGAIVQRMHEVRSGTLSKRKWLGPIAHILWKWPRYTLRATFADGECLDNLSMVLVTRVRNYGGLLRLVPGIDPADGQLHALCFRQRSRAAWLWQGLRGLTTGLRPSANLLVRHTTSVRVDCVDQEPAPTQLDGDFAGTTPADISILGATARICSH